MITPEVLAEIQTASKRCELARAEHKAAIADLERLLCERLGVASAFEGTRLLRAHARAERRKAAAERAAARYSDARVGDPTWRSRPRIHLEGGPPTPEEIALLTPKQREVLELRAAGVSMQNIAARLGISGNAANMRRASAFEQIEAMRTGRQPLPVRRRGDPSKPRLPRRARVNLEGGPPTDEELAALPERQRAILIAVRDGGKTGSDIAQQFGISDSVFYDEKRRGRLAIQRMRGGGAGPVESLAPAQPAPEIAVPEVEQRDPVDETTAPATDLDPNNLPDPPFVSKLKLGRRRTESRPYLTRDEQHHAALVPYPTDVERPKTRGDCAEGPRPCPWVSCKYHLLLEVTESDTLLIRHGTIDPAEIPETCLLDVADQGGLTLEETGRLLNVTRERTRQIEVTALRKIAAAAEARAFGLDAPARRGAE